MEYVALVKLAEEAAGLAARARVLEQADAAWNLDEASDALVRAAILARPVEKEEEREE